MYGIFTSHFIQKYLALKEKFKTDVCKHLYIECHQEVSKTAKIKNALVMVVSVSEYRDF